MFARPKQTKQSWEPQGNWVSVSYPASKLFSHLFSGAGALEIARQSRSSSYSFSSGGLCPSCPQETAC